jgi:hypothetical protein
MHPILKAQNNTNWPGRSQSESTTNDLENQLDNIDDNYANCAVIKLPTEICMPVPLNTLPVPLSTKIKVCQVCNYEMRQFKWRSVAFCGRHGVRICTEIVKP